MYCGLNCYNKLKEDMQSGIIKPTDQLAKGSDVVSTVKAKGTEEGTAATHTASTPGSVAAVTDTWQKYNDEDDRLSKDKLDLLADSDKIKMLLTNPHLRQMLTFIDSSEDKEQGMENAMKEPIFVEFADACLALVESDSDDDRSPGPTETFVEVKEFELLQF
ncbi:zinc finger HIT domain-containing protein 3-like isoform X2 [Apostichopus japonicus]|uniref:zinc finger HIT domain-containing protein 3-like isoform X2 n=1 Tax=Stichopus japonicus TaxID=307972 RepID=UPI003AB670BF